jgi:transcriptional regulator with XRE-family HTH domain
MDEGLRQTEVARRLGVDAMTYRLWEWDRARPGVRLIARVIAFIGCDPVPAGTSLPSRLRAYRRREGITQREVAARLGVAVDTATRWEWRGQKPRAEHWPAIERVLGPTDPAPPDLPNRLRQTRRKLGLTQEEFGAKLGLGQHVVSDWERGRCEPLPARRAKLEKLLAKLEM